MRTSSVCQIAAWKKLLACQRKILVSHRPDDLERDQALRASILTALQNVYGPRTLGFEIARVEEGEDGGDETRWPRQDGPVMSYGEVGEVMGLSRGGVQALEARAFRKLRENARHLRHLVNDCFEESGCMSRYQAVFENRKFVAMAQASAIRRAEFERLQQEKLRMTHEEWKVNESEWKRRVALVREH